MLAHAEVHYSSSFTRLQISFRGKICFIDAFVEPGNSPSKNSRCSVRPLRSTRSDSGRPLSIFVDSVLSVETNGLLLVTRNVVR